MKKLASLVVLIAGFAVLAPDVAARADDPNLAMMKRLFSKLTGAITIGTQGTIDQNGAIPGQTFFTIMNPGMFVDPSISTSTKAGREALANLGDRLPLVNWLYQESNRTISDVYERILDDTLQINSPQTPAERQQLAAARTLLYTADGMPSTAYQKYLNQQAEYYNAFAACELDRKEAPQCSAPLRTARQVAEQKWRTIGRKNDIEAAIEIEYQLTRTAQNWWSDLRLRFNNAKEQGPHGEFYRINTYPAYATWFDDAGWTRITISQSELEQVMESNRTSFGGSGSVSYGLFSFGASYNRTTLQQMAEAHVNDLSIQMEIKRVSLYRPWLNRAVFDSRQWCFKPGKEITISDGAGTSDRAPTGVMPLLPTGLLLARKARIAGLDDHDLQTHYEDHISSGGSIGFGFFAIGGHYNEDRTRGYRHASHVGNGLEIADPQIIGWFSEVLPKTPDPVPAACAAPVTDNR